MKTYKIWVEQEDITRDLIEVEAESCEGIFHDQLHIDGKVLDSWEDGIRNEVCSE